MPTQEAVRWNIKVSKETDLSLRSFFTSQGMKKGDRSKFIEQAVLSQVFHRTVKDIHTRNSDVDPQQIEAEIELALREVRTEVPSRAPIRQPSA